MGIEETITFYPSRGCNHSKQACKYQPRPQAPLFRQSESGQISLQTLGLPTNLSRFEGFEQGYSTSESLDNWISLEVERWAEPIGKGNCSVTLA